MHCTYMYVHTNVMIHTYEVILYVLGAVYQAAALSKAFVVKKFLIKEATVYPIEVRNYTCVVCRHMHTVINMSTILKT